jgi:plasmid stability protein
MATLTIRNLSDEVHSRLRIKAAKNGRSLEAEVRELLTDLSGVRREKPVDPDKAVQRIRRMIRKAHGGKMPTGVVDKFLKERRRDWGEE